jgi:uncharacterized protein (TIGR02757 family)
VDKVLDLSSLRAFLDEKVMQYNTAAFIPDDPVSVPRGFSRKEDIEISGFLAASIAWGRRETIVKNAGKLMQYMDYEPYKFILSAADSEYRPFKKFVHRTFNGNDCIYFLKALKHIYKGHGGLEQLFNQGVDATGNMMDAISYVRNIFFGIQHPARTGKHFADPLKNASAKRINMFLRWMVRQDKCGVDFGLWKSIPASMLMCPLDLHTGNTARMLGLLSHRPNDRKAVEELTAQLRLLDAHDPVKYDFALFGLGIYEKFAG